MLEALNCSIFSACVEKCAHTETLIELWFPLNLSAGHSTSSSLLEGNMLRFLIMVCAWLVNCSPYELWFMAVSKCRCPSSCSSTALLILHSALHRVLTAGQQTKLPALAAFSSWSCNLRTFFPVPVKHLLMSKQVGHWCTPSEACFKFYRKLKVGAGWGCQGR